MAARRGKLEPQIEKLKALYAPRLDACLAALDKYIPDAVATRPDGGFFLSLTLPQGVSTTDLRAAAAKLNLNLADGLAFFPQGGGERFLRLPVLRADAGADRRRHQAACAGGESRPTLSSHPGTGRLEIGCPGISASRASRAASHHSARGTHDRSAWRC